MGFLKLLLNANNADGIREAMRMAYRKSRKDAVRGIPPSDFGPHVVGLMGAMASRLAVNNRPVHPTALWHEIAPFAAIQDEEVATETLAEYAVYVERTVDTKLAGLKEVVNSWIRRTAESDELMLLMSNPLSESCRWWGLLENDVVDRLRDVRARRRDLQ